MSKRPPLPQGFLIIDKPAGLTSHDVVVQVRRVMQEYTQKAGVLTGQAGSPAVAPPAGGAKAGHAGTLDPFATGVLLVLIGSATRLVEYVHLLPKTYEAEITLGATSDTDDVTGKISSREKEKKPTKQHILQILDHFTGTIQQIPPVYAAIKVKGKKLYEYARSGKKVERNSRTITIKKIEVLDYAYPKLRITVTCSTGTYIRALARDIGASLGTGAYLAALRRTAIGPFTVQNAIALDTLTAENLAIYVQPPTMLVNHLVSVTLSDAQIVHIKHGRTTAAHISLPQDQPLALLDQHQTLIGIGRYDAAAHVIRPEKIFQ